jgi:hypothetical protein
MPPEATGMTLFSEAQSCSKNRPFSRLHRRVGVAQRVVEAADHLRVAFELADHGAGVDVVDARHAHPLADDAEVHAVVLLPRVGAVAGAVQVQDHVVLARPLGHRLDRRVADHQVDHDDHAAQLLANSARSYMSSIVPAVTFR